MLLDLVDRRTGFEVRRVPRFPAAMDGDRALTRPVVPRGAAALCPVFPRPGAGRRLP